MLYTRLQTHLPRGRSDHCIWRALCSQTIASEAIVLRNHCLQIQFSWRQTSSWIIIVIDTSLGTVVFKDHDHYL